MYQKQISRFDVLSYSFFFWILTWDLSMLLEYTLQSARVHVRNHPLENLKACIYIYFVAFHLYTWNIRHTTRSPMTATCVSWNYLKKIIQKKNKTPAKSQDVIYCLQVFFLNPSTFSKKRYTLYWDIIIYCASLKSDIK